MPNPQVLILTHILILTHENESENEDKKNGCKVKLHSRYFFGTSGRNRTGTPEGTGF